MNLDLIDLEIVRLLMRDGRLTHEEIAKRVSLSRPAVHERIRKMERNGVLKGYRAVVDWEALGLPIAAFTFMETTGKCSEVGDRVFALGSDRVEVVECHRIIGEWCLMVRVQTASMQALDEFLDRLAEVEGVVRKETTISLAEFEDRSSAAIRESVGAGR